MDMMSAFGAAGGALVGGLAGSQKSRDTQEMNTILAPESEYAIKAGKQMGQMLDEQGNLIGKGPGEQDVTGALDAQRSLAALFQQYSQGGFMPSQQDMGYASQFANSMFAPQQTAMNQQFQDMQMQNNRGMAKMGRGPADPVFMNKMFSEQARQQAMLESQKTAYASQHAQQMPMQRLGFAQQYSQTMNGLASQAMANRQALFSMGNQLRTGEQGFRSSTASRNFVTESGGGFKGALTGSMAGFSTGMGAGNGGNGGATSSGGGGGMGGWSQSGGSTAGGAMDGAGSSGGGGMGMDSGMMFA